ncbi:hypothetical protein [Thalassolituus hydrocarboniclasticus]|uniref:Uncharacterized protein n=1 Tax=Thalassolituus hydrocarboniclasticus TaxID=2742796 RepID=A0ABY6A9Y3_9GAMM|nr:hypothetical protein [Thalassolituus hydrocarboniclasticus]UXD87209.1 hypothetical protein HUF19_07105 [Thalassolituus hydrocarboniclasticus]
MKTETIKNITTALLLGAVGSGIWSLAGEPAFKWCVDAFISIAQILNAGYYDLLHINIGKGLHEESGIFFRLLFSYVLASAVLVLPFLAHKTYKRAASIKDRKKKEEEDIDKSIFSVQKKSRLIFIFTIIYAVIAFPIMISRIITQEYNNEAVVFIERSIEILSPELTSSEIIRLRADYRAISNAESFYSVFDNMQKIASKKNIELPSFDVAR